MLVLLFSFENIINSIIKYNNNNIVIIIIKIIISKSYTSFAKEGRCRSFSGFHILHYIWQKHADIGHFLSPYESQLSEMRELLIRLLFTITWILAGVIDANPSSPLTR